MTEYPVPESKWYEFSDLFTRVDEELAVIIQQLNAVIKLLVAIAGARTTVQSTAEISLPGGKIRVEIPRIEATGIYTPLRMLPPSEKDVTPSDDTPYTFGDTTILAWVLPWDTDIWINYQPTTGRTNFPVTSGTLLALHPSKDQRTIYMRAMTTPGKVYILEFEKGE